MVSLTQWEKKKTGLCLTENTCKDVMIQKFIYLLTLKLSLSFPNSNQNAFILTDHLLLVLKKVKNDALSRAKALIMFVNYFI